MHASTTESVELAAFRLRDIAALWYEGWERSRGTNVPPATWDHFAEAFLDHYLPREIRVARVDQFLNLRQGSMSVRDYGLRFDSLARYAPLIVGTMEDRLHRFIAGLAPEYLEACTIAALREDMDISRIQALAQNLEELRHRQSGAERAERGQQRRPRPFHFQEDFQGVLDPDILAGHLGLHCSRPRAARMIVGDSQAQGRVHGLQDHNGIGPQISLDQLCHIVRLVVDHILGGAIKALQPVILVAKKAIYRNIIHSGASRVQERVCNQQ